MCGCDLSLCAGAMQDGVHATPFVPGSREWGGELRLCQHLGPGEQDWVRHCARWPPVCVRETSVRSEQGLSVCVLLSV